MDANLPEPEVVPVSPPPTSPKILLMVFGFVSVAIVFSVLGFFLGRFLTPATVPSTVSQVQNQPVSGTAAQTPYQNPFDQSSQAQTYENPFQ